MLKSTCPLMPGSLPASVDDGLHLIVLLDDVEPGKHRCLELVVGLVLGFMLHVQYGRQVAILQFHLAQEVAGLALGRRMDAVEMVGATGETVLTGLVKVLAEVLVGLGRAFGGLDHDEADGVTVDGALVLQYVPVDVSLMVGDVDAVYFVAFGIADITVQSPPAEAEGADEEVVEEPDVARHNGQSAYPPAP